MKKLKVTKLHGTFLAMNLLPIILMGLVITIFSANRFAASMYHEVQGGLKDLCNTIQVTIDELYPGAYHVEETEDAIYITVKDNGIGMSDQFLKHIYEPFERERNSTISRIEGSGIGMGIVKRLVELMDGSVDVQSKIGEGSAFTVTIPCKIASKEESIAKRDKGTHDKASLVGARILVVEDNDINAEIATELLEEEGCIIERACNGVECFDMLEKADDLHYAMILMDIQMPVMNGYEATTKIRRMKNQSKAQIPIIAMTANAFTEDKQMALDVGMNDHVSKPIDMNILVPIMMRFCEWGSE